MPNPVATTVAPQRRRATAVPETLLTREGVLRVLEAARTSRVLCLRAPGGYGKTTALVQWSQRDSRHDIWLRVRRGAAEPLWLAQGLVDALFERGLVPGPVALGTSVDAVSWQHHTLPGLERALSYVREPVLVVVDDAQELSGTRWEGLVECLAATLPTGSQLALASRGEVPGSLWRLQSRGEVEVIGPDVLAFDLEEATRLIEMLGSRGHPDTVGALMAHTAGWPVAVSLAAAAPQSVGPGGPSPGSDAMAHYLRLEILGRLSPDDAQFLCQVSVLRRLDPVACDAITGVGGSLARLRRLASVSHLLVAGNDKAEVFRMLPPLSEFLSRELHERDPGRWRTGHASASAIAERRGDLDLAVQHARLSGDDELLGRLIWTHAGARLGEGRWDVLRRWLDGIDEERLGADGGLALSGAWLACHVGDMERMSRLALAAAEGAGEADAVRAQDVAMLTATIGAEGLAQVEAASRECIRSKPRLDAWPTLAHFLLGVALFLRDRDDEATAVFREGYRLAAAMDLPLMVAHCLGGLADVALARGDEQKALVCIREMRGVASTRGVDAIATAAPIFTTSAVGYVLEGRLIDAKREAARALRMTSMMRTVAPWHAVQGRLSLARVSLALGDADRARMLLEEAGDARIPAAASSRLDRLYAETRQRLVETSAGLAGDSSLTTAEVRVLQYLPTHLSFPQIADELFVSRHTVKTQAMSAYRKLGVHTRAEAIVTARRAGLLPGA